MDTSPQNSASATIDIGVVDELTGYHLRRAAGLFLADFTRVLAGMGIRQPLFGILSVVSRNPRIGQGMVGQLLAIKRANMVPLITELVEAGLIVREASTDDRRALELSLTQQGEDMLATCTEKIMAHEACLLNGFSQADRRMLLSLLKRFAALCE